jgi:hypothetical protein
MTAQSKNRLNCNAFQIERRARMQRRASALLRVRVLTPLPLRACASMRAGDFRRGEFHRARMQNDAAASNVLCDLRDGNDVGCRRGQGTVAALKC